jgi:DNA-binding transcriptional ArsR family regulator
MFNSINHFHGTSGSLKNKFAQPISCSYICNRTVAKMTVLHFMRRDVFQAIADPTRRAILSLLALQAMTPNALADHFDSSRQAISKHIKILTECQLVTQEQTGREIYYHFNSKKLKEVDKWLQQFRAQWDTRFTQLDTLLKTIKNKKS